MANAEMLSVEYFTSHPLDEFRRAHEAALPLWESGQPVPALHRPVARLHLSAEVLTWLEDEVRALGKAHDDEELLLESREGDDPAEFSNWVAGSKSTPRLTNFLRTARDLFVQVIRTDLDRDEDAPVDKIIAITAGPYEAEPEFCNWHRDFEEIGGITYVMSMLGKSTIYSMDNTRKADFDTESNLLPFRTPRSTWQYGALIISAHHSTFTAHRGPGPETNGHSRILFNRFVYDAL